MDAGSVTVTPEISQSPTSAPVNAPVNASNSDDGGLGLMEIIIIVIGCLVFCSSIIFGLIFFGGGGPKISSKDELNNSGLKLEVVEESPKLSL